MATKGTLLVTGGAGYIGSHTITLLVQAGYQPVIIDNFSHASPQIMPALNTLTGQQVPLHQGNCANAPFVANVLKQYPNVVGILHFAAYKSVRQSVQQPIDYYHNNLGALTGVLKGVELAGLQNLLLVFSSSCTVYGQPPKLPVTEQTPLGPATNPYGHTKQMCEALVNHSIAQGLPLKALHLRYFNPVGAHPSIEIGEWPIGAPSYLVPYITQAAAGLRPPLKVFGHQLPTPDGTPIRDYLHVMDVAQAHLLALEHLQQSPQANNSVPAFNLGTGRGYSVLEMINTFQEATGVKVPYKLAQAQPGDAVQIFASAQKAQKELDWQQQYTLAQGLQHAWQWQQKVKHLVH